MNQEQMLNDVMVGNIDKTIYNMDVTENNEQIPTQTAFHSRATEMKTRVRRQNRNLWLTILCFIPTCGFCCGQCIPE